MRALILLTALLLLPTVAYAADALEILQNLTIVDSRGVELGAYTGTLTFRFNGRLFFVSILPDGFRGVGALLYEAENCAGSPITDPAAAFVPTAAVGPPGATVYLPEVGATPTTRTAHSFRHHTGCQNFKDVQPFPVPPRTFSSV